MASISSESKPKKPCEEFITRGIDLLESAQWSDCSFLVGPGPDPELIPGFKLILALTSPVFEAMFYGSLAEKNNPITISDVNPTDFKVLLNYIYTNELNLSSVDQAGGLYYCGKKFLLTNLQTLCSEYLLLELAASNACSIFEYGQLFEDINLTDKATEIMTDATMLVIKDPSFNKVRISTMVHLFSLEKLSIDSEMNLLEAAVTYSKSQDNQTTQNKKTDKAELSLQIAIEKIRFRTVKEGEFAENQAKLVILTESEVLAIILNLISDKTNVSYPSRLSNSRVYRIQDNTQKYILFTIQDFRNVNKSVVSPRFYFKNISWQLMVRPEPHPYNDENEDKYLGLHLICNSEKKTSKWSCNASCTFKLVSLNCENNISRTFKLHFSDLTNSMRLSKFMSWKNVLDPRKMFVNNGAIEVSACVQSINV